MKEEEKYEKIERYLKNKLSTDELKDFEVLLQQKPDLLKEVNLHREIFESMSEPDVDSFRSKLITVNSELKESSNKTGKKAKSVLLKRIASMAAALLVLVVCYFLYQNNKVIDTDELYASYFEMPLEEDFLSNTINRGDTTTKFEDSKLLNAKAAYKINDHQSALKILQSIETIDRPSQYYYHLGILQLATKDYDRAINSFDKVKSGFDENAQWYKVLANVKLGRIEDARAELLSIKKKHPQFKKREITELLKSLSHIAKSKNTDK